MGLTAVPRVMPPKQPDPSVLKTVQATFSIELHPSKLDNVAEGVREQLNASLLRYSDDFEGVVIAYHNEKVLSKQATVHPYFPLCHVDVSARVVLFKPRPGSYLVGAVNKVGDDHIGLLVYGVFNAVIPADQMSSEFNCNLQELQWRSRSDASHVIGLGSEVQFRVELLQDLDPHFRILGSLKDVRTGLIGQLPQGQQQQRRRQANGNTEVQQQPGAAAQPEQQGKSSSKKEKKKKKVKGDVAAEAAEQQQHQQNGTAGKAGASAAASAPEQKQPSSKKKKHKQKDKEREKQPAAEAAGAPTAQQQQKQQQQQQQKQQQQQQDKKRKHKAAEVEPPSSVERPKAKKQKGTKGDKGE